MTKIGNFLKKQKINHYLESIVRMRTDNFIIMFHKTYNLSRKVVENPPYFNSEYKHFAFIGRQIV